MGQALANRIVEQQVASAASNISVPGLAGVDQTDGSDGSTWWCKLLARAAGVLAGVVNLITGVFGTLMSVLDPLGIFGSILLIFVSVVILVFEAPICCTFIQYTKPIAAFAEKRTMFQKAIIYCVMAIGTFLLCRSIPTFVSCGLIFATGVIYGLMGLGRKADRQQMMAAAATEQPRRASGARADDAQVGLIGNESAISAEPFVGQNFQK